MRHLDQDPITFPEPLIWRYGRPAELWLANERFIGRLIEELRLTPTDPRHFWGSDEVITPMSRSEERQELRPAVIVRKDFPGGKRTPHLHYLGEYYALDDEQWARFASEMVERFTSKLHRAGTVPLDKLIEAAEAIESM